MKKVKKKKITIIIIIIFILLCFLICYPFIHFSKNEKKLENAGRRYFEKNPNELPTANKIKTIYLKKLYKESYQKESINVPYTNKLCSIENSWVKVKKTDAGYQYYTYLDCWPFSSKIDHEGPTITLNDSKEIKLEVGEEFTDPGVKSVIDNVDGKMDISNVISKNNVDTSKTGTYEITYTAIDKLDNTTTVKRKVQVVQTIYKTISEKLKDKTNFSGEQSNNYIRLSNMLFQVYGVDEDKNIIIISDEDIANVNYTKIDAWLEYYFNHLNENTKKMIVEKKYCNDILTEDKINTVDCSSYTKPKKVYIPSIDMINKVEENNKNFMKPYTISWTSNKQDEKKAYATRQIFFAEDAGKKYVAYDVEDNYGIRPMMTIKGDSLIIGGEGSISNPYIFNDTKKARGGTLVNKRYTGEYISIKGDLYRIIETESDGTTRILSNFTVGSFDENITCNANPDNDVIVYDPKNDSSVAYFINNRISAYVDTSYFENHKIKVPIYSDKIIYQEEVETKEYKVKLSAPNMYEMFSAQPQRGGITWSYWLINSSKAERTTGLIYLIGVPINEKVYNFENAYIRFAAYLKKDTMISSGDGTFESPYIIK